MYSFKNSVPVSCCVPYIAWAAWTHILHVRSSRSISSFQRAIKIWCELYISL